MGIRTLSTLLCVLLLAPSALAQTTTISFYGTLNDRVVLTGAPSSFVQLPTGTGSRVYLLGAQDLQSAHVVLSWNARTPLNAVLSLTLLDAQGTVLGAAQGTSPLTVDLGAQSLAGGLYAELRGSCTDAEGHGVCANTAQPFHLSGTVAFT